ncbi:MAG: DegT/DnrJ/EryC1/StrS family aminotransferase [Myxococcales bacterium]|nr:DegT/DnrJ/EryC1/StrS family aminotransferase [Myxococcales bacterium]
MTRHREVADEAERNVQAVLRSGRWIGGPWVQRAESTAAEWFSRRWAVGVASGTDALMLALMAAGVRPGDEVIVPALSFFATAGAVVNVGAVPVVVDVGRDGLLDPQAAEAAVGPRTRGCVPVHLFGNRAAPLALGVPVVDDAAQAVGTVPSCSTGVLSAVSAYPTKTWGAAGDAGFVLGDDPELERVVRALANHGSTGSDLHQAMDGCVGRASRLDAVQAAVLMAHAPEVARRVQRRRELADRFDAALPASILPLPRQPGCSVHQYCVLAEDREALVRHLDAAGVGWAIYYGRPLSEQPALTSFPHRETPVARWMCERLLALPVRASLTEEEVERIVDVLRGIPT